MDLVELQELLHSVRAKKELLEELIIKRNEIMATVLPSCGCYEDIGGSGRRYKSDKIGCAIVKAADIEGDILKLFDEYITAYEKVRELAYKCEPLASVILIRRYILGQKWDDIAQELELTRSYVFRIHKQALLKLTEAY